MATPKVRVMYAAENCRSARVSGRQRSAAFFTARLEENLRDGIGSRASSFFLLVEFLARRLHCSIVPEADSKARLLRQFQPVVLSKELKIEDLQ